MHDSPLYWIGAVISIPLLAFGWHAWSRWYFYDPDDAPLSCNSPAASDSSSADRRNTL